MTRQISRLLSRLSYANVVATIALFAAVGTGGAYAASRIGAKQLRTGAVNSRVLKNHGVALKDLSAKTRRTLNTNQRTSVSRDGALIRTGTARSASRDATTNGYVVIFKRSVARCTPAVTLAPNGTDEPGAGGTATITGGGGSEVDVSTYDAAGAPTPASFNLILAC